MERLHSVPAEYDEAINIVIAKFEALNGPRNKGFIKISARPAGTNFILADEFWTRDNRNDPHQQIFDRFCVLLNKARTQFGSKDFHFEIFNLRGDSLLKIRIGTSKKVRAVLAAVATTEPKKNEEAPKPAESSPRPTPQTIAARPPRIRVYVPDTPANNAESSAQESAPATAEAAPTGAGSATISPEPAANDVAELVPCPNPDEPMDYDSMKYLRTDMTASILRRVFEVCGIKTNGDLLWRLGTLEPTRVDWEIFIKSLRAQAAPAGAKLGDSSDGTLYWWLVSKKGWVRKFPPK